MEVRIHARTTSVWFLTLALLAVLAAMLDGCSSSRIETASAAGPAIEFTSVPLAGEDDPKQLYIIKGRVMGAQPGEQIVLYAKGQSTWWVQPFADHPFTKIQGDSVWNSQTHPGIEYAALLVGPDYHPQFTADVLPTEGVLASAVSKGRLPFWEKWWFPFLCMIAGAPIVLVAHRLRIRQMCKKMDLRLEERLAERTRVAQELHDTMLQTVLSASMQLHVAVDQLPADSPVLPAMNRVLQLMGQVAQEGRNTVRGLRSSIDSAHDLKTSLSRVPEELARKFDIDFRVVVEGSSLPLRPVIRDDVYSIGREALVNAFRHSKANNIELRLEYSASHLRIIVRDDGCGIDTPILQSGRYGHWGLSGMRERAERIGAKFKVFSRPGTGTEVELRVPNNVAFTSPPSSLVSRLFFSLRRRQKQTVLAHNEREGYERAR